MMKKKWLIGLLLAVMVVVFVTPVVFGDDKTSDWFGPYGTNSPGVFYRYIQSSLATDYDSVQFENRNNERVKIDYVTVQYPNTWYTLFLDGGERQDPAAAIVQGDRLKLVRVTP